MDEVEWTGGATLGRQHNMQQVTEDLRHARRGQGKGEKGTKKPSACLQPSLASLEEVELKLELHRRLHHHSVGEGSAVASRKQGTELKPESGPNGRMTVDGAENESAQSREVWLRKSGVLNSCDDEDDDEENDGDADDGGG